MGQEKTKEGSPEEDQNTGSVSKADRRQARDVDAIAAVEDLYMRHYQSLVRSLSFIVLDREAAADAAQEAFFQLYLKWDRIRGYDDPVAWLYRVAINKCRDHTRALARAARLIDRMKGVAEEREQTHWHIQSELLWALHGLPKRQRTAAALHYVAGFSVSQVAEAMKVSEGTAKTHLFRAREGLRRQLEVME